MRSIGDFLSGGGFCVAETCVGDAPAPPLLILIAHLGANKSATSKKIRRWDFGNELSQAQLGRLVSARKGAEKVVEWLAGHASMLQAHQGQVLLDFP
jgi:hypothetical protein